MIGLEQLLKFKKRKTKVICVETNEIFDSATEASLHFGKGRGYVSNIMRKDKPSNLGYHFKYLEE